MTKAADSFTGPSFGLSNQLARLLWNFTWLLLFLPSPRPAHAWRRGLLRLFGAEVGAGAHIYPGVRIWAPWNLRLGAECGVGDGVILYSQANIEIGYRAVISQGTHLCTGTHDYTRAAFPLLSLPIVVGKYAWIASESFIHPGVTIGEGAVIGARSVVTRDIPAWCVCVGHPCMPIRKREFKE